MSYDFLTILISGLNLGWLTVIAAAIDNDIIFAALVLAAAFLAERGKKRNRLLMNLVIIFALGLAVKSIVREARPCTEGIIISKIQCPTGFSFPSDHALIAFALATALWKKPKGYVFAIAAAFVAFTRVYLGVHSAFDVLGGAVLGIAAYIVLDFTWTTLPRRYKDRLSLLIE